MPGVSRASNVITSVAGPAPEANPVNIEVRTPLFRRGGGTLLNSEISLIRPPMGSQICGSINEVALLLKTTLMAALDILY